jgi:hypothetical protein
MDGEAKKFDESAVKDVKNQLNTSYSSNSQQLQQGRHQFTTVDNNFNTNHNSSSAVTSSNVILSNSSNSDMNTNYMQKQNLSNGDGNVNKLSENNYKTSTPYVLNSSGNFTKVNNNNNNNSTTNNNKIIVSSSSNQQILVANQHQHATNMPKNEPVKLVYPAVSGTQVIGGTSGGSQQGTTVLNMNNRIAYTTTTLPNGTISLSHQQQNLLQQSTGVKTSMQSQQPTIIIKNQGSGAGVITSNAPGIYTMTKTINNQVSVNVG